MLDAAAGEMTAITARILHTHSFATYEAFACKKKTQQLGVKQRIYFQSANSNYCLNVFQLQHCCRNTAECHVCGFGSILRSHRTKCPQLKTRLNCSQGVENHIQVFVHFLIQ